MLTLGSRMSFFICFRYLGFVGCISDFKEENNKGMFDLTKLDMVGPDKSGGSCYSVAQPGLGFNGSSWARFGKHPHFKMLMWSIYPGLTLEASV